MHDGYSGSGGGDFGNFHHTSAAMLARAIRERTITLGSSLRLVEDEGRGDRNGGDKVGLVGEESLDVLTLEKKIKIEPASLR